jgi:hypothetical protein
MSKKHKSKNIQLNSIDISTEHMKRPELVLKLATRLDGNRFVRLTSPAASGKTSLLSLYELSYPDKHIIYISFKIYGKSCNELFMANGIDLENKTVNDEIRQNDTIVLIDDAQEKYDNIGFWEDLIKVSPKWLPANIKFVIVSTHLLIGGKSPSPAEMEELPKLERKDFLLSYNESLQFLESPVIGLPLKMQFDTLKILIAEESCGLIGSLRRSVDFLTEYLEKDVNPSEKNILQLFLSEDLLPYLGRCFGPRHSKPIGDDFKMLLKKILADGKPTLKLLASQEDNESFYFLKKAGILIEDGSSVCFSSPLAKRFYFKKIYPGRLMEKPESLFYLI